MDTIILIGFMGAGKTTVGQLLAEKFAIPFIDMDEYLEKKVGMSIGDIFSKYGEAGFRLEESKVLEELLGVTGVIATGGGVVTQEKNRQLLKNHQPVVFLKADPQVFLKRIKEDEKNNRPLATEKSPQEIFDLYQSREALYTVCADIELDTTSCTQQEVVDQLFEKMRG